MFGDNVYKLYTLHSPCSVKKTNYLFKYDKKVAILKTKKKEKKRRKNHLIPPAISNKFDIHRLQIFSLNLSKIRWIFVYKIGGRRWVVQIKRFYPTNDHQWSLIYKSLVLVGTFVWCDLGLKPDSHRRIVKDYRSKTGKYQEILSESGWNPMKIVWNCNFQTILEDFTQIPSKFHGLYLSLACNLWRSFCVNLA